MKAIRSPILWILAALAVIYAGLSAGPGVFAALIPGGAVGPTVAVPGTNPVINFPAWYRDQNGVALQLCLDPGTCFGTTADLNPGGAGEAFWWAAEIAGMPVGTGGSALLVLAMEAAFSGGPPVPGDEAAFGRIRIRVSGITAGATYTVTHPFGQQTFVADPGPGSQINFSSDIGCFGVANVTACDFTIPLSSGIGPFLVWDPAVAPAPPAGFIGDGAIPHKVTGSPTGNNFFRIVGPEGTFQSDLFVVQGKLAIGASNDTVRVPDGAAGVPIAVLANDTPPGQETLTVDAVTPVTTTVGTAADSNTHITFDATGAPGTGTFTYTVASSGGITGTARLAVTTHAGNTAPVGTTDAVTLTINSGANIVNVLANDTDADNDLLFVKAVTQPAGGAAVGTVAADPAGRNVTYTPAAGVAGNTSFTYTMSDGLAPDVVVTVNVFINRAPTPVNDTALITANTSNNIINVLANDTDPDGTAITVSAVTTATHGTTAVGTAGANVTYTPTANFGGTDAITYTVSDGNLTATARVDITVNRLPVAVSDTARVSQNSSNNAIPVLTNDSDPDGNTITISALGTPAKGSVAIGPGALNLIYTPQVDVFGTDPFTYTISDGNLTATSAVTVTINRAPLAVPDNVKVPQSAISHTITALTNDSDPDSDTITVSAVTQGANGSVSIGTGGADVRYTPSGAFIGNDSFTYTITDGGMTASAAVTVTVHRGPRAGDDTFTVIYNSLDNVLDVLANDRELDGDTLTVASATQPINGVVTVDPTGINIKYSPDPSFTGADTFEYTVTDGQITDIGRVTITVNRPPLPANDTVTVKRNSLDNPINVLANDTDPNGDTLRVIAVTQGTHGLVIVGAGGVNILFSCETGVTGTDTFTYTVSDGTLTATATVTVNIPAQSVSNVPPLAVNDVVSVPRNSTANAINALANDSDPDGDSVRVSAIGTPSNGIATVGQGGSVIFYSPNAGFIGADSFTYTITDGLLFTTGTINVSIPANSAPVAVNDTIPVPLNSANNPLPVLANDTDADGDPLRVITVGTAANGTVSVGADGRSVIYTPNPGFAGTETLTYTVSDGTVGSTADVSVTVHALNAPPVALADTATVPLNSSGNVILVLSNDVDPDGDPISVASVTQGANGTVAVAVGRGRVTYTPNLDFHGTDSFTYTAVDGALLSPATTVTITVHGAKFYLPLLPHREFSGW